MKRANVTTGVQPPHDRREASTTTPERARILVDLLFLKAFQVLCHLFPRLPGRILRYAGFRLFMDEMYSTRWAKLGVRPVRIGKPGAWMLMDLGYWHQRYAYLFGHHYERNVTAYLREALRPGATFVDIGANIGFHTLHAASIVGPHGMCVSVEPSPTSFGLLAAHVAANRLQNVSCHHTALGSKKALLHLDCSLSEDPRASISYAKDLPQAANAAPGVEVTAVTGDELLAGIPASAAGVCKIDVEGYEYEVLSGMQDFIASHPSFSYCVEITPKWIRDRSGATAGQIIELFGRSGFKAHVLDRWGKYRLLTSIPAEQFDAVFVKPC